MYFTIIFKNKAYMKLRTGKKQRQILHFMYFTIIFKNKAYMKLRTEKKQRQIDKLKIKES